MFKKILILALALNTTHVPPARSSTDLKARLVLGLAGSASAIGGVWLVYKNGTDLWQNAKENQRLTKLFNDTGARIEITTETKIQPGLGVTYYVQKISRNLNIPSNLSLDEKNRATEYWNLLVANEKNGEKMATKALLGVALTPIGLLFLIASCIGANQA